MIRSQEARRAARRPPAARRPQCAVKWDRNLKPKLAIMRQCTSVTDGRTDRRTDGLASWHKREMYILHLALITRLFELRTGFVVALIEQSLCMSHWAAPFPPQICPFLVISVLYQLDSLDLTFPFIVVSVCMILSPTFWHWIAYNVLMCR